MRTYDWKLIAGEVYRWKGHVDEFEAENWTADERNIALTDDDKNVALFQYERPGVYIGHYFFHARGRKALEVGRKFLKEIFDMEGVEVIKGYTPVTHLGARWLSRQLGFKSYGALQFDEDSHELFILTKKEL